MQHTVFNFLLAVFWISKILAMKLSTENNTSPYFSYFGDLPKKIIYSVTQLWIPWHLCISSNFFLHLPFKGRILADDAEKTGRKTRSKQGAWCNHPCFFKGILEKPLILTHLIEFVLVFSKWSCIPITICNRLTIVIFLKRGFGG